MAFGWEGKLTRLVPLDKAKHFENLIRWVNDPEVTQWLLIGDFPLTRLAEEEWFEQASKSSEKEIAFAIETLEGEHLGTTGLHQISFRHGTAFSGSFIGAKHLWGKGYGSDQAKVRARYAFEVLGLRLLMSSSLDGNEGSQKMLLRTGYVEYGRIPGRYYKRGAYRDEILMMLSRNRWDEVKDI